MARWREPKDPPLLKVRTRYSSILWFLKSLCWAHDNANNNIKLGNPWDGLILYIVGGEEIYPATVPYLTCE